MFFEREVDLSLYYCTEITFCLTFGSGVFRLQFLRVRKCKQQDKNIEKGENRKLRGHARINIDISNVAYSLYISMFLFSSYAL